METDISFVMGLRWGLRTERQQGPGKTGMIMTDMGFGNLTWLNRSQRNDPLPLPNPEGHTQKAPETARRFELKKKPRKQSVTLGEYAKILEILTKTYGYVTRPSATFTRQGNYSVEFQTLSEGRIIVLMTPLYQVIA